MTRDLTEGIPIKQILIFAIPIYFGMLFQQFYNVVDTVIVGKFLGIRALAGVGSTGSINFLVLGFCNGMCSGFAIPIARQFGAKDYSEMRRYTANAIWISALMAVVVTFFVSLFCRRILVAMNTPEDAFEHAYSYILIIFLGIPFTIFYNLQAGILRSLGDSRTPLYFLILSSLLNIVLDLLTILVFGMGVSGPAAATIFSQAVSGLICFFYIRKRYGILKMSREEMKVSGRHIRRLCGLGVPMGLQFSITAIGSIILQTSMNGLGSIAVASVAAANKINMFMACPFDALGSAMASFIAQNLGARKIERIVSGERSAVLCGFAVSVLLAVIVGLFGARLISIFLDEPNQEVLDYAARYLKVVSLSYFLLALVNIVRFSIQGLGFSAISIISGVMEMIARSVIGLVLVPRFGFSAVCFSQPLAWGMADIFLVPCFIILVRRVRKSLAVEQNIINQK